MKITMYELLGMIKDGKAPKKILYNNYRVYELDEYNHYMYKDIDNKYIDLYDETFNCELDEFLNDEVEIIEEEPKVQVELTEKEYLEYLDKINKYMESVRNYIPKPSFLKLEEEKKIPEKLIPTSLKGINNLDEKIEIAHIDTVSVIETLNQVIDYLKSKGE